MYWERKEGLLGKAQKLNSSEYRVVHSRANYFNATSQDDVLLVYAFRHADAIPRCCRCRFPCLVFSLRHSEVYNGSGVLPMAIQATPGFANISHWMG